jgi:hypothetical protein
MNVAVSEVYADVKEKYCKTKCRHAGILFGVNFMICFKFKLELKFRINKNYFSVIVKFRTGLRQTVH